MSLTTPSADYSSSLRSVGLIINRCSSGKILCFHMESDVGIRIIRNSRDLPKGSTFFRYIKIAAFHSSGPLVKSAT